MLLPREPTMPIINEPAEMAAHMGISEMALWRCILRPDRCYQRFTIAKKSGGRRTICAPTGPLKAIQRWLCTNVLNTAEVHDAATGYRKGRSILTNARPHADKNFVFNVDIEDFFGSIPASRVYALFRSLAYNTQFSRWLTRLTTYRGHLPQGAPSSPLIANLICAELDQRLSHLCTAQGWSYTRYCDDITISGNDSFIRGRENVTAIIEAAGFKLNRRKMRFVTRSGRQVVTGLVVNKTPNISRHRRRQCRALFHKAALEPELFRDRIDELQGQIAFLSMICPADPAIPRYKQVLSLLGEGQQKDSP